MQIQSAESQKQVFMELLVTELQNQNPLEPMDNKDMAAQLAQFSQLEMTEQMSSNMLNMNTTMEKMNSSFQGAMMVSEYNYAKSMLDKKITFFSPDYNSDVEGEVTKFNIDPVTGYSSLTVSVKDYKLPNGQHCNDDFNVPISKVIGIQDND